VIAQQHQDEVIGESKSGDMHEIEKFHDKQENDVPQATQQSVNKDGLFLIEK
jgi:hypothetical protein